MKKIVKWILGIAGGIVLLILILLYTVPVLFRDKIKAKVEQVINESVNAQVSFAGYKLGFFRNFPDLNFSLKSVSVAGTGKFLGDTLASLESFDLRFNLSSLFKKSGYEIKSIVLDRVKINAIVLDDGSANWDIAKESAVAEEPATDTTASTLKVLLRNFEIRNSSIRYKDLSNKITAALNDLNFNLKGDMTASETDLFMALNIGEANVLVDKIKYLNKTIIDASIGLHANLEEMKFTFGENYLALNDLRLNFSGLVAMPGDDIETDLTFGTGDTSFKTLLSLIPAFYMKDFQDLTASGNFKLNGSAKGVYSDRDSTMPDISVDLSVSNGLVSYPDLPEKIRDININLDAFVDGKEADATTLNVDLFHFQLAGNPFDITMALKNPVSDPDLKGSLLGKLDLAALTRAVPIDSMDLSGIIDLSVKFAGRLSMIEKGQYDKFQAQGNMSVQNMLIAMTGYPGVKISEGGLEFTPAYASLTGADIRVGERSDFLISGRLENYIPYILKDKTIKGSLSLRSRSVDASEILSGMSADTTAVEDTAALAVIKIPGNIDFDFNAAIDRFIYDKINAENIRGHIIIRDGVLSLRETGMNMLGGTIAMNADYDTRDSLKPVMKADFMIQSMGIRDAFTTFNTIQKLAPAAEGVEGKMNVNLSFQSMLGSDMMPLISSIAGGGKLQSNEITLVKSAAFDKMKELLKLNEKYTNTFKDLNVSFKLSEGRVYVSPFDTKVGNIRMNISGDQGLDQTMNYLVKTEFPRSELGGAVNSLLDNLSAAASAYGLSYKPAEIMKVNVRLSGVFGKPVVTPVFGSGGESGQPGTTGTVKESVRQVVGTGVDEGREKLRQEAEARGDALIREAESRAAQITAEAAKAAEKVRQEADLQSQKLITEASSKGAIAKLAAQKAADKIKQEADKKAVQITTEADIQANKIIEEAKAKKQEMIEKI